MKPEFHNSNNIPTIIDFNKRDPDNQHANLSYAEKLSVNIYSNNIGFKFMNSLLRNEMGEFESVLNNQSYFSHLLQLIREFDSRRVIKDEIERYFPFF